MERLILPSTVTSGISEALAAGTEKTPISEAAGIILAGGMGSRMQEVTHGRIPKQILPLTSSSAILDNPINLIRQAGVRTIYIVTMDSRYGHIKRSLNKSNNFDGINYVVEDYPPKGVINSVKIAIREKGIQTTVIKTDGDEAYLDFDLREMYNEHVRRNNPVTCLLSKAKGAMEKYRIGIDETNKVVVANEAINVNGDGWFALAGLWIIEPSQFYLIHESTSHGEFMRKCIAKGVLYGYVSRSSFFNINRPEDLNRARAIFGR